MIFLCRETWPRLHVLPVSHLHLLIVFLNACFFLFHGDCRPSVICSSFRSSVKVPLHEIIWCVSVPPWLILFLFLYLPLFLSISLYLSLSLWQHHPFFSNAADAGKQSPPPLGATLLFHFLIGAEQTSNWLFVKSLLLEGWLSSSVFFSKRPP